MKKQILSVFAAAAVLLLSGCATNITYTTMRPAELDMNGAKSIAVLPFSASAQATTSAGASIVINLYPAYDDKDSSQIANAMTTKLSQRLIADGVYSVVPATAVANALANGTEVPVDAYITGYVSNVFNATENGEEWKSRVLPDGTVNIYKDVRRTVSVEIVFQVIDAREGKLLAYKTYSTPMAESDWYTSYDELPPAVNLASSGLDTLSELISNNVTAHEFNITVSLLEDKTKNEDMKSATNIAKAGNWVEAMNKFYGVYESTGMFEAGYNAALLRQATGDLSGAKELMMKLVSDTGDKRAVKQLTKINEEIEYATKYEAQQAAAAAK